MKKATTQNIAKKLRRGEVSVFDLWDEPQTSMDNWLAPSQHDVKL